MYPVNILTCETQSQPINATMTPAEKRPSSVDDQLQQHFCLPQSKPPFFKNILQVHLLSEYVTGPVLADPESSGCCTGDI